MAKVFAPYKKYSGISAGVTFKDGVGETSDPHLLEWFKSRGYRVEKPELQPAPAPLPAEGPPKKASPIPELPEEAVIEPDPPVETPPKKGKRKK